MLCVFWFYKWFWFSFDLYRIVSYRFFRICGAWLRRLLFGCFHFVFVVFTFCNIFNFCIFPTSHIHLHTQRGTICTRISIEHKTKTSKSNQIKSNLLLKLVLKTKPNTFFSCFKICATNSAIKIIYFSYTHLKKSFSIVSVSVSLLHCFVTFCSHF